MNGQDVAARRVWSERCLVLKAEGLLLALLYLMAFSSLLPKPCSPFPFSLTNSIAYPRLAPLRISIRSFLTNPISNPLHSRSSPARLSFRAWAEGHRGKPEAPPPLPPSPPPERKSFAVATGELFLGLASLLVRSRGSAFVAVPPDAEVYVDGRGASNGSVVEESVDGDAIWEQMSKDVEAEKERNKVTSPGFSFSAAGLLFPYHLGVAQFLLEKGYIKVILCSSDYGFNYPFVPKMPACFSISCCGRKGVIIGNRT
ncbi:hypothetical protein B296_00050359 [Ensete ventricosum]|uniref:Uncharacterized protein n=1 Tax=Ensete ventricosum TaxID=4639 RepID=A0A426YLM4_ENSVE|nr:hypothetical protein B296_00050359 [Ensete ventricosum]